MKQILLMTSLYVLFGGLSAHANMTHSGYCSEFENRNGCTGEYSSTDHETACSCPGNSTPPRSPLTGTRCGPPNHMSGMTYCCSYENNIIQGCWTD